jgi:thioredoxin 2
LAARRPSVIIRGVASIATCPSCGARNRLRPHARAVPRCARCKAPLPWLVEAGPDTFAEEVRAAVPVVVDFWAPWCGPCRMVSPALEAMARERAGALKIVKLNVDEAPGLAAEYRTMSIPTLVVMRDGREVDRVVGALPPPELERRLAPSLQG